MAKQKPNPNDLKFKSSSERMGDEPSLVVGLGASAGGIGALSDFFSQVPKDTNVAFIVILHISPEHESKLAQILQHRTEIPVTQVQQREKIKPNHVYVVPPNRGLAMVDGHVEPTEVIGIEERRSPIDLFFRTLAETTKDRAVSVILSGTGADGSIGLKRIKEHGGIAFAQEPDEAEYKDMPRNAILTGMIDYVLPVSQIPAKILLYKERFSVVPKLETEADGKRDEQALASIFTQIRTRTGHDFSNYKRGTLRRRIERRMGLLELSALADYARYLRETPEEVQTLMKDLLISVTNFFRDSAALEGLAAGVITQLLEKKKTGDLRIWVPACATGEEAFTLSMLVAECAGGDGVPANLQLFATDLDEQAIRKAREAFYTEAEVADVSPDRLRRFFTPEAGGYRVRRELRETTLFAVHNVIRDPPFSHLDLVSCRNLLIYLNRVAQARVLEIFHFALNTEGYLFLGASESIEGAGDLFRIVDKENHVFRSRPVPRSGFPVPEVTFKPRGLPPLEIGKTAEQLRAMERLSFADLHQRLLEKYAAPSVVVNEEYDIVHLSDQAGKYMQLSGGEPSNNLLNVIRHELRTELRTALYRAIHDRINVETRGLKVSTREGDEIINVIVRPVLREDDTNRGFILVLFETADEPDTSDVGNDAVAQNEPLTTRLEDELVHLKSQLRGTVEQYEIQQEELRASNEELQAMNEELRSAAEELETSREELQSVNEELVTVNQELKIKIEELSLANNNFQNLMNSTDIGTIFLTRDLRVRQFTPKAKETFNLIDTDVGRHLMDIRTKLKHDAVSDDIDAVLNKLQTIEREVKTHDHSYIMRLSPYRTIDDKIDGVVITMVDITERSLAADIVRRAGEELEMKVQQRTRDLAEANKNLEGEIRERKLSEEARVRLLGQLVNAQEDERRRFARDLHDQLGQQLTALSLKLESLKGRRPRAPTSATVDELQSIVKKLDNDVDFLAWELRPVALDELGLQAALANYTRQWAQHHAIEMNFHANLQGLRLAPEVEAHLYRVAQEALNNCAKHANCTQADVILEQRDEHLVLVVEDNGVGFVLDQEADGHREIDSTRQLGLLGMRERVALLGGRFEIESEPGNGTTVLVRIPIVSKSLLLNP